MQIFLSLIFDRLPEDGIILLVGEKFTKGGNEYRKVPSKER